MSAPTEWQDAIVANLGATIRALRSDLEGTVNQVNALQRELNQLRHDHTRVPPLIRQHIESLLDYNEADEAKDFENETVDGVVPENHIYTAICSIRLWLSFLPDQEPIT